MIRYYLNGIVFDRDLILSIRSMLHLDRQLLNSILASRRKSSAHIFKKLDMIAQADDLHQSYILHTDYAWDSNEDDQCGLTFPSLNI